MLAKQALSKVNLPAYDNNLSLQPAILLITLSITGCKIILFNFE
jgi:hypothetical protein